MFKALLLRCPVMVASALAVIAVLAAGGVDTPASAAPVQLAASTAGPVTVNCSFTCSAYLSRSATKRAYSKLTVGGGGFAAMAAAICGPIGIAVPPAGIACGAAATLHGGWIAQEITDSSSSIAYMHTHNLQWSSIHA